MIWIVLLVLVGGFVLVFAVLDSIAEQNRPRDSIWRNSIESDEEYRRRIERPKWKGRLPDPLSLRPHIDLGNKRE